jgi:hypothetical protein
VPIQELLKVEYGPVFDPEDAANLTAAFDAALKKLCLVDRKDPDDHDGRETHHSPCEGWRARPPEALRWRPSDYPEVGRLNLRPRACP